MTAILGRECYRNALIVVTDYILIFDNNSSIEHYGQDNDKSKLIVMSCFCEDGSISGRVSDV